MKNKIAILVACLMLVTSSIVFFQIENVKAAGTTLYVGGSGPGNYSSIQSAIDNASNGDTVYVYNGTYYENLDITKDGINLIGEDKTTTIIDSIYGYGNSIRILNCDNVNVSGFTVRNAQIDYGFIYPEWTGHGMLIWAWVHMGGSETANHITISDCIIYNNSIDGVRIGASDAGQDASYNSIKNCEIYSNGVDPSFDGHGVIIMPDRDGVTNWAYTRNNEVENCSIYNNTIGIRIGREGEASNNIISGCEIFDNIQYGIYLWGSDGGGVVAITSNNFIYDNNIYGNHLYGLCIKTRDGANCGNNYIYHNNFLNNSNNSYDEHTNYWDNGYPSGGNYWDDYTGIDSDGDGIGDTPYNISGGSNQDMYPFMYPNGWIGPDTVYVDDDYDSSTSGWQYNRFDIIQDGIDAVNESGTVYVFNGTYYENVDITKDGINLIGEDENSTIIDGIYNIGSIIMLENHNYVNISRFSIRNAQHSGSPLEGNGILFFAHSHGASGVTVNNNIISDCKIYNNSRHGIKFASHDSWNQKSNNNSIINCEIYSNGYNGIRLSAGETCVVRNTIILSSKIYNNGISEGPPVGYRTGISFSAKGHVSNTLISECDFYDNHHCGVFIERHPEQGTPSNNNIIYHNNFLNDTNNAYDECTNTWYNATLQEGNYWSDFDEPNEGAYDNDSDGIGDTPYPILGGSNQDNYPFMNPNGWLLPPNNQPSANFTFTPTNPINTDIIEFTDTSTDNDGAITSWYWDFGDGYYSDLQNPIHCYYNDGTYDVTLTVTDDDGATDTIIKSIVVISPSNDIQELINDIEDMNLHHGLENSLTQKLMNVIQSIGYGWINDAINQLNAFIHQVEAQRGKKLTESQADYLVATAQGIIDAL